MTTLPDSDTAGGPAGLYLDLLKKILLNTIYEDSAVPNPLYGEEQYDQQARLAGIDWPTRAHTMVGIARLDNVQECLERVVADKVAGDFIETGVWRGGVCIFARAVLKALGVTDRRIWVADSFEGIPAVGESGHPADRDLQLDQYNDVLAISEQTVRENFDRYGLLDDQVEFLRGWFRDTLPSAPIDRLAIMRLDGDLYESTTDALVNLYPKLSVGGYVIIDDYRIPGCKEAVHDFRGKQGIEGDTLEEIDEWSVFWRRTG
jgi:Macrocin-O-methyltransferase (TylF)